MKSIIFCGVLALGAAMPGLLAQNKKVTREEAEAYNAMIRAQTADERIAAAENLVTKFADSQFRATALYFEALSYEQKGDYDHSVVFGERTLETDPKHYQAMLMLAMEIAQHTREYDLDKAEKLARVDKYAKTALELLKDAPKPNPNLTDDQWAGAKKEYESEAHAALGMGALADKQFAAAEREFKSAVEATNTPDPSNIVRLGKVYADEGKYDDAIAQYDKVMAIPDVNPTVRQIAQAERVRAIQKKGAAHPPAPAAKPDASKPEAPKP
ncbi:MAG TPA: hypothetical protein VMI94_19560 [Bryobacteraceae bacterium]|nr:hypothetical protein [Bryobacteraceae bacterium]